MRKTAPPAVRQAGFIHGLFEIKQLELQGTQELLGQWLSNIFDHDPQFKINLYHNSLGLQAHTPMVRA